MQNILLLCDRIRQIGYSIHVYHGPGNFEKIYQNALAHRLARSGIQVRASFPIPIFDEDGTLLGDYTADLLVEDRLIVEVKAVRALADEHVAQVLGYLKGSRREHGLLINFGSEKFQIRKYILTSPTSDVPKAEPIEPEKPETKDGPSGQET